MVVIDKLVIIGGGGMRRKKNIGVSCLELERVRGAQRFWYISGPSRWVGWDRNWKP